MNDFYSRKLGWALFIAFALGGPVSAWAQADRSKEDDLKRKTEEIERLKQDLSRAQEELKKIKGDKEGTRPQQVATPPAAPPAPTVPLDTLPALGPTDTVEASVVAAHFQADPAGAAKRYVKKTFRIRGEVGRFGTKLVLRSYEVVLESADKRALIVCEFDYITKDFNAVYTKQNGELLVARSGRSETTLLRLGQTIVIRGQCDGLKDGRIAFHNCDVMSAPSLNKK